MIMNNQKRTTYKKSLGWKKVTQKFNYVADAQLEQFFIFYFFIPLVGAGFGGIITFFMWDLQISQFAKILPIAILAGLGILGSFIFRNYTDKVKDAINREADEMTADRQIAGTKLLSPKKYAQQYPKHGGVVRIEQKHIYRRKQDLVKVIKKGNVEFVSNSDQYDYFEPFLMQDFGLMILATKILTDDEQNELRNQEKEFDEAFDEIEINAHDDVHHININDSEKLKEFGIEKLERADVLIPLSQYSTHMYIQGRAGSGKSVLYGKFYRAVMGNSGKVDDGIFKVKPDLKVLEILKQRGVTDLSKKEQELIDALKCKNVIIDTKGDIYHKYFRGDFEIENTDWTITKGKDIVYAGGLDKNSIPYDFSKDLLNDDGTLNKVATQNFAEAIFKTAEITSDAEKFWAVNGKNVTRAAITAIAAEGKLTNKELYKWLKSDKLVDLIKDNHEAAQIAGAAIEGKSDSERILGILSGITEKAIFLEWIATDRESAGDFSFKKWFNDGVPGTLFLVASDEIVDILMPLYGIITTFMLEAIFTREDKNPNDLPVNWFGDEMPKMGKISKIEQGLTFGRSKGLRMFPGAQNNAQLKELYGERFTSIVEGAGNKALFAQGGPDSADFCAKYIGTSRVISKNNGVRMSDEEEHTQNENRDNNYKEVLDSDFMNLQPTSFYLLGETGAYTKVSINFNKIEQRRPETEKFKLSIQEAEAVVRKRFTTEEDIDVDFDLDDLDMDDDDVEI